MATYSVTQLLNHHFSQRKAVAELAYFWSTTIRCSYMKSVKSSATLKDIILLSMLYAADEPFV